MSKIESRHLFRNVPGSLPGLDFILDDNEQAQKDSLSMHRLADQHNGTYRIVMDQVPPSSLPNGSSTTVCLTVARQVESGDRSRHMSLAPVH
jgi:hypothetical protein